MGGRERQTTLRVAGAGDQVQWPIGQSGGTDGSSGQDGFQGPNLGVDARKI